jgi:lactoylglutathione lyase
MLFVRRFSTRPFRVLGVQQVALGSENKAQLREFWGETMGLKFEHSFTSERENVDEDVMRIGTGVHSVEVDLMAPLDPEKSPKVHKPALNHIGLWIDDLPKAVEHLESKGVKVLGGIRKGASGHDITFLHPKSACGVLVELVQATPEVIAEFDKNH